MRGLRPAGFKPDRCTDEGPLGADLLVTNRLAAHRLQRLICTLCIQVHLPSLRLYRATRLSRRVFFSVELNLSFTAKSPYHAVKTA